jgi:predicted kinase
MATTMVPTSGPVFIQMSGAPGSGKSTMAKLLQQSTGGLVIDHDVIRSTLLEDNDLPFDQIAKIAYRLQWALAREMAQQRVNVIIDSTCNFQEVLDSGTAVAEQHGFAYWYIECKVDDIDLLDERLRMRTPMKSQRTAVAKRPAALARAKTRALCSGSGSTLLVVHRATLLSWIRRVVWRRGGTSF